MTGRDRTDVRDLAVWVWKMVAFTFGTIGGMILGVFVVGAPVFLALVVSAAVSAVVVWATRFIGTIIDAIIGD